MSDAKWAETQIPKQMDVSVPALLVSLEKLTCFCRFSCDFLSCLSSAGFQPSGSVSVGAFGDVAYSYNVASDNLNGRTIQGFSTDAKAKMYECEFCPYKTYEKFYDYYGAFDYANQWVLSAFNQGSTDFTNGKADFSKFGDEGLNGKSVFILHCRFVRLLCCQI